MDVEKPLYLEEKVPLYPRPETHRKRPAAESRPRRHYFVTRILPAALILLATLSLFRATFVCHHHYNPTLTPHGPDSLKEARNGNEVPLEIHVMSKCPDAKDCLRQLVVPTMEQVSDKVNFTMSFIGSIDPNSDAVSCKHGPGECLGNVILLCAAHVYADVKVWLGFANCMISDYQEIPQRDLVEDCAMEHGVDFQKLNTCISEEGEGVGLLRSSILRSQENNVTKSCTVRLAGKIRCIRDGGEWYDCPGGSSVEDLVHDIDDLYNRESI
ncbi:hypothetical protein A1O1_02539 [Capronia coronata CBS 617.96]|uniref:Gamma interferon inducible lysosomal thiol reductase n=1 Tax=Capronia coronata CBS 617.96 TaxID=1182541 RepID=W9YXY6_9EURO|nr:uncharacterized protein A1O1_02539 [Capronia coronata CBS 617.96]EXJ94146.1 hypothetical protein A1O1_02539 [Capronia coronata CBS 617.96]